MIDNISKYIHLKIASYRKRRHERQRRQAIAAIRGHLAFFGYDTSKMSDEEIEAGVIRFGMGMANLGVTMREVGKNLAIFANQLKEKK